MSVEINDLENTEIDTTYIDDIKSSRIEDFYIGNIVNIPLIKGEKGDKGDKGDKPVVGVDYYTEAEKTEFKDAVIQDSKTDIDEYTSSKKNEYNDNATEKIQEYNSNATSKTETFNTNAQNKIDEYNTNAESLINRIAGVESKNTEQDTNIANKVDKEAGKGLSSNDYTDAEKEKLASLSNYDDTEIQTEITSIKAKNKEQDTKIENKVEKVEGKELSTNDYTTEEKEKLASLSNYDDTEIQTEITSINETNTEQDKKIQELEKENIKLRNQIPNGTVSGNEIHLEDSSDMELSIEKIAGGYYQASEENSPSPDYPSKIETVGSNVNYLNWNDCEEGKSWTETGKTKNVSTWAINDYQEVDMGNITFSTDFEIPTGSSLGRMLTFDKDKKIISNQLITKLPYTVNLENAKYYTYFFVSQLVPFESKLKLEKGTVATAYSPYNQGSVNLSVGNKNSFNVKQTGLTSATNAGITAVLNDDNSITLNGTATNDSTIVLDSIIPYLNFVKDKTYSIFQEYISGNATNKLYSHFIFINKKGKTTWGWLNCNAQNSSGLAKKTTLENGYSNKLCLYCVKGTTFTNYTIKLMVAEGDYTLDTILPYIDYQSQTITMPIQQEMLEGDYINDVEHHEWGKVILTGNDFNYLVQQNGKGLNYFIFRYPLIKIKGRIISNMLKNNVNIWDATQYIDCVTVSNKQNIINIMLSDTTITTVAQFKAKLQELYNAGTPLILYYELAEPLDLELTTEQKVIREQKLHTYKNVTNISLNNDLAIVDVSYKKDVETITKNCVQKEDGKELSSNDYTDAEKEKLASLSNYNDTEIKADITGIKSKNAEQDTNIANKVDKEIGKGLSSNDYTDAEKEKLASLSNYNDTEIKADITGIKAKNKEQDTKIENKVEKVEGKGLSTNDYTTEEKEELARLGNSINIIYDRLNFNDSFLFLTDTNAQKEYTITSEENKVIELTNATLNGFPYYYLRSSSNCIKMSRNMFVEVSATVKFYTTPSDCDISVTLNKNGEEIFSTDIIKTKSNSKVNAYIPSMIIEVQEDDLITLGFKSSIAGKYTIIQNKTFLKVKSIKKINIPV